MKTLRSKRGFTRLELAGVLVLAGFLILVAGPFRISRGRDTKAFSEAKSGKAIYNWLQAYANDHDQVFPVAKNNSNEAFRQLFTGGYLTDEEIFAIPGDAWLKNAPGGKGMPDNKIGPAPDFPNALEPGECSWAYVTGLDAASQSNLPLLSSAFSETTGVYSTDKKRKGGVLGGKAIWVSVGGSAKVAEGPVVREKKDVRDMDVFGPDWGTNPANMKNPAP
ncbi:MAG: type II secretion system protein [Verrucomicrobiota bacterium]